MQKITPLILCTFLVTTCSPPRQVITGSYFIYKTAKETTVFSNIKGIVYSKETNRPIAGSSVTVLNKKIGAITDMNGELNSQLTPGKYRFRTSYTGYTDLATRKMVVPDEHTLHLKFWLGTVKQF